MSRRPDNFELAVADFDHVMIVDVLVGLRDRAVHRCAHPRGAHAGWIELLDRKSVAGKERARFGTVVRCHLAELYHAACALGLEPMNVRNRVTAATNLAGRAEVINMMMRRDDCVEIFDLDAEFRERFLERLDALRRVHPGVDQRPRAVTIEEIDVDDSRPHGQRQKYLVDTWMDLNYFRHRLLSVAGLAWLGGLARRRLCACLRYCLFV